MDLQQRAITDKNLVRYFFPNCYLENIDIGKKFAKQTDVPAIPVCPTVTVGDQFNRGCGVSLLQVCESPGTIRRTGRHPDMADTADVNCHFHLGRFLIFKALKTG